MKQIRVNVSKKLLENKEEKGGRNLARAKFPPLLCFCAKFQKFRTIQMCHMAWLC